MNVADRVRDLVAPLLIKEGLELFDVEFGGGRLAVLVDRPGGIDLGALTSATHQISAVLDGADPIPGRYLLEVSSPGLERTLRTPEHYRRFVGSLVSVKTKPGIDGDRRTTGTLSGSDDDGFTVGERRFCYRDVERCHTVFEWGPAPRPIHPPAGKGKAAKRSERSKVAQKRGLGEASLDSGAHADVRSPAGAAPSAESQAPAHLSAPADCHPFSDTKATAS